MTLLFRLILELEAGQNLVKFNINTTTPGRYSVSRFCLFYEDQSRVEFVSDILSPTVHVEVLNNPPVITMGLEDEKEG